MSFNSRCTRCNRPSLRKCRWSTSCSTGMKSPRSSRKGTANGLLNLRNVMYYLSAYGGLPYPCRAIGGRQAVPLHPLLPPDRGSTIRPCEPWTRPRPLAGLGYGRAHRGVPLPTKRTRARFLAPLGMTWRRVDEDDCEVRESAPSPVAFRLVTTLERDTLSPRERARHSWVYFRIGKEASAAGAGSELISAGEVSMPAVLSATKRSISSSRAGTISSSLTRRMALPSR